MIEVLEVLVTKHGANGHLRKKTRHEFAFETHKCLGRLERIAFANEFKWQKPIYYNSKCMQMKGTHKIPVSELVLQSQQAVKKESWTW